MASNNAVQAMKIAVKKKLDKILFCLSWPLLFLMSLAYRLGKQHGACLILHHTLQNPQKNHNTATVHLSINPEPDHNSQPEDPALHLYTLQQKTLTYTLYSQHLILHVHLCDSNALWTLKLVVLLYSTFYLAFKLLY